MSGFHGFPPAAWQFLDLLRVAVAPGSFDAFVVPRLPVLWRVARSRCRSTHDAEDLVQALWCAPARASAASTALTRAAAALGIPTGTVTSRLHRARRLRTDLIRHPDPGFDLIYARTGSIFIARDNGPDAIAGVTQLGTTTDAEVPTVIFPEGRLFRPDRLERAVAGLQEQNPRPRRATRDLATRPATPPRRCRRAAGRDSRRHRAHRPRRLDWYPSFARAVPLTEPVRVTAWRVGQDDIPDGADERIAWLDHHWCDVDRWILATLDSSA
jgi:Sigma-70 region 2